MSATPIANQLTERLQVLNPTELVLENESMYHAGYFDGKESHFKLTIVSHIFTNQRLVKRHQQVYQAVNELLVQAGGSVHALAIHAYTPEEWQQVGSSPASPSCAGHRH